MLSCKWKKEALPIFRIDKILPARETIFFSWVLKFDKISPLKCVGLNIGG